MYVKPAINSSTLAPEGMMRGAPFTEDSLKMPCVVYVQRIPHR